MAVGVGVFMLARPAIASTGGSMGELTNTRGLRNKNPGNIEYNAANNWLGQIGSDGRYAVFVDMKYGVRAIGKVINTYRAKYGLNTIRGIVSRWAPPAENLTFAYIASVAQYVEKGADEPLTDADMVPLVAAIIRHENGVQPFEHDYIAGALRL